MSKPNKYANLPLNIFISLHHPPYHTCLHKSMKHGTIFQCIKKSPHQLNKLLALVRELQDHCQKESLSLNPMLRLLN